MEVTQTASHRQLPSQGAVDMIRPPGKLTEIQPLRHLVCPSPALRTPPGPPPAPPALPTVCVLFPSILESIGSREGELPSHGQGPTMADHTERSWQRQGSQRSPIHRAHAPRLHSGDVQEWQTRAVRRELTPRGVGSPLEGRTFPLMECSSVPREPAPERRILSFSYPFPRMRVPGLLEGQVLCSRSRKELSGR